MHCCKVDELACFPPFIQYVKSVITRTCTCVHAYTCTRRDGGGGAPPSTLKGVERRAVKGGEGTVTSHHKEDHIPYRGSKWPDTDSGAHS